MVKKTDTAEKILLFMLKNPLEKYNPRQIAQNFNISHAGSFKLLAGLYTEGFLTRQKVGRYNLYTLNFLKPALRKYLSFLIQKEKDRQTTLVKVWINDINKRITQASIALLFGSILYKEKPHDVDVVFVISKKATAFYKEIDTLNALYPLKIHPVVQTRQDLLDNIRKGDRVILKSLGGIVVFGDEKFFDLLAEIVNSGR